MKASSVALLCCTALLVERVVTGLPNSGDVYDETVWKPLGQTLDAFRGANELGPLFSLSSNGRILAHRTSESSSVAVSKYDETTQSWNTLQTLNSSAAQVLSLSPSGEFLAIRHETTAAVSVYSVYDQRLIGNIQDCPGQFLQLYEPHYLAVSCDAYDHQRGMARVYQYRGDNKEWVPVVSIVGDEQGDGFGWRVALDVTMTSGNRLFRMAISAPFANLETGFVRVFDVFRDGSHAQVGKDVVGKESGENFGLTIALTQTSNSILAIGAPNSSNRGILRGSVRLYAFQRTPFHGAWMESQQINGTVDYGKLGESIALTPDASSLAISSTSEKIQLYHSSTVYPPTFTLSSTLSGHPSNSKSGRGLSMSRSGSIIATDCAKNNKSYENNSFIRVFIDQSPYCGYPGALFEAPFMDRQLCQDGYDFVTDERACEAIQFNRQGRDITCIWIDPRTQSGPNQGPSQTPSRAPYLGPTRAPESKPTLKPSHEPTFTSGFFGLEGCPCDEMGRCTDKPLEEGSRLGLCITGRNRNMQLVGVTSLTLALDDVRALVIDESGSKFRDGVSSSCSIDFCSIRTPVDRSFYIKSDSGSLVASGVVLVAFPSGLDRMLRGSSVETRNVLGEFSITCPLQNSSSPLNDQNRDNDGNEEPLSGAKLFITLVFMMLLVMGCCWCFTCKEGPKCIFRCKSRN